MIPRILERVKPELRLPLAICYLRYDTDRNRVNIKLTLLPGRVLLSLKGARYLTGGEHNSQFTFPKKVREACTDTDVAELTAFVMLRENLAQWYNYEQEAIKNRQDHNDRFNGTFSAKRLKETGGVRQT